MCTRTCCASGYARRQPTHSAAYRSPNRFIEDQFAEMVRFAFGLNPKHSYQVKKTLIDEKSALEAQTRKIAAAQRVLEYQSRGVDDSDPSQSVLQRSSLSRSMRFASRSTRGAPRTLPR